MFNKLKRWYWWITRDKKAGSAFEADVTSLSRPTIAVEEDMVMISEDTEAYQKYLAYCVKHDILDKEVDTCAKLVNKSYELYYARAVEYLLADDKKKENSNDWN